MNHAARQRQSLQEVAPVTIESLQWGGILSRKAATINLENVRILSISKVRKVPIRGRKGGATKGKGKGSTKGKEKIPMEHGVAAYFGSEGNVICALAYGEGVDALQPYIGAAQALVHVTSIDRRAGKEELFFSSATTITTCIEPIHTDGPFVFPYDTSAVNARYATQAYVQNATIGSFVDIVLRATQVEERETSDNSPYLLVSGVDMDGDYVGPFRLWQFDIADLQNGNISILRGLKVSYETYWDDNAGKYVSNTQGGKRWLYARFGLLSKT